MQKQHPDVKATRETTREKQRRTEQAEGVGRARTERQGEKQKKKASKEAECTNRYLQAEERPSRTEDGRQKLRDLPRGHAVEGRGI